MATNNHLNELISKFRDQNLPQEEIDTLENFGNALKVLVLGGKRIEIQGVSIGSDSIYLLESNQVGTQKITHIIDCNPHSAINGAETYLGSAYLRRNIMGAIWGNIPYQSMPALNDCCKISQEYFESQIMPKKNPSGELIIKRSIFTPDEFVQSIFGAKYGNERSKIEAKVLEALYKGNELGNKFTNGFKQISEELYKAVQFDMTAQLSDKYNPFTEINEEDFKEFANSVNNGLIAVENVEVKAGGDIETVAYSKMTDKVNEVIDAVVEDIKETELMQDFGPNNDNVSTTDVATSDTTDVGMDVPVNV